MNHILLIPVFFLALLGGGTLWMDAFDQDNPIIFATAAAVCVSAVICSMIWLSLVLA